MFLNHRSFLLDSKRYSTSTTQDIEFSRWFADKGDKIHRLSYPLKSDSLVIDLGGYHGDWSSEIFCKYDCNILIFEPVDMFFNLIRQRFSHNSKIKIFPFGLSDKDSRLNMSINEDNTSFYKQSHNNIEVNLKMALSFFRENNLKHIDLLKINIEGGEYDLLDHMISTELTSFIDNIQIQFHSFVPNAVNRMRVIRDALSKTHYTTYRYDFVWENWKKY